MIQPRTHDSATNFVSQPRFWSVQASPFFNFPAGSRESVLGGFGCGVMGSSKTTKTHLKEKKKPEKTSKKSAASGTVAHGKVKSGNKTKKEKRPQELPGGAAERKGKKARREDKKDETKPAGHCAKAFSHSWF